MADARQFLRQLASWRRYLIIILTPLVLLPIPVVIQAREARCAYTILIMAVYWVTEVVPLAVTSLLPLVLFPLLGVLGAKDVSLPYFKDTNALFVGGLIVAVAIEHWNLHKRIALRVLLLVGAQPRRLMLGFMLITAFLSMWISNTATTAMMVPIAEAVLMELKKDRKNALEERGEAEGGNIELKALESDKKDTVDEDKTETSEVADVEGTTRKRKSSSRSTETPDEDKDAADDEFFTRMSKALVLCVAYAANVGGTATLTGTGSNLVFNGQAQSIFPESPTMGFGQWFSFAFPQMIILVFVSWAWLQFYFLGCCSCKRNEARKDEQEQAINKIIRDQYDEMGPMSFAEGAVLAHFITLALLWLLREPKFMPGWDVIFVKGYVRDATAAMLIAFSLFVFPSEKPKIFCWNPDGEVVDPPPRLLTFKTVALKLPWNVVFLLGGGFALAEGAKRSGLSEWLGEQLVSMRAIPDYGIVIIVCVMLTMFTEVTSNVATATIFLPILGTVARSIGTHPWYLMIPATVSCSFAFMLPVATPPNAIVFSYGHLKVKDMAKAGFTMNIVCVIILLVCFHVYGVAVFGLDTVPAWAMRDDPTSATNYTLVCKNVTL